MQSKWHPLKATLLLSHAHWDHIQGLPFFAPGYLPQNRIRIFAANGHGPRLQQALINQMAPVHFPVALEQMKGLGPVEELDRDTTHLGSFAVRTTELNHPGGCAGFRLELNGVSLGYLPDHEPYELDKAKDEKAAKSYGELIAFMRGLDLLILDTQYTATEYEQRRGWGHGCLPVSVRMAIEANVSRLMLFHHDPSHDDSQIDQMVETARELAQDSSLRIDAAAENEVFGLSRAETATSVLAKARVDPNPVSA
jgi:phosphoribosyl 1,2-cyclic phosphodiesterase